MCDESVGGGQRYSPMYGERGFRIDVSGVCMIVCCVYMRIVSNSKDDHLAYDVSNGEWVRSNGYYSLYQYMENELCIRGDGMYMHSYKGVGYYYVRNVYGLEYNSCSGRYVGGVESGRAILDPWGRVFSVFPYQGRNGGNVLHGCDCYYSDMVNSVMYQDERKVDRGVIKDNVIVLATSVNRRIVYCVDILAGIYDHF